MSMISRLRSIGGGSSGPMKGTYSTPAVCSSRKYVQACSTSSGCAKSWSAVRASTRAPATAPLCAMGVAIAMALDQWWPGRPGTFDGKRSVTVGTFHEMSPNVVGSAAPARARGAELRKRGHRARPRLQR